jgi:polysaccharide biosynthesis/export protein
MMDRAIRQCIWVVLLSLLPSLLSAQAGTGAVESVILRPGDAVQITVFRKPELSGEFTISAAGAVDHPLYQAVSVAGVPLSVVRDRLNTFLKGWEAEPYFLVKPLFKVAVGGQVTRPDLYTFPPETTIAQAVAVAGGVSERGRLDRVRVLRQDEEVFVDLTQPNADGIRMTVHSGDQIIVEQTRTQAFRDYVAPAGTLVMAAVSLISVLLR